MRLTALLASLALAPALASASQLPVHVMAFPDEVWGGVGVVYTEDDISVQWTGLQQAPGYLNFGTIHQPSVSSADFTMAADFIPLSIDVLARRSGWCSTGGIAGPPTQTEIPAQCASSAYDDEFPYIWLSGYLDDQLVESAGFYLPSATFLQTISLSHFGAIDRLHVEVREYWYSGLTGYCPGGSTNCAMFGLDNVTLASVPEPGTLILLSSALAGLAFTRRKRAA